MTRQLGTCETMTLAESGRIWLSSKPEARANAIELCEACPVLDVCREVHSDLVSVHGVVAGKDYTRKAGTIPMAANRAKKEKAA